MQTLQAVITGSIQGLSEFLPISSSAHIVFSNELFRIITNTQIAQAADSEEIFFDIMVHLATLFAVVIYFFKDLKNIFKGFFVSLSNKNYKDENFKLVIYIALSTVITGAVGFLIKERVEKIINHPEYICILLFITGLILFFSEVKYKGNKKINLKNTIIIAIAQGLAVFPGFSRSGLTISAALFSFLMSIPVILFASMLYPMIEFDFNQISTFNFKAIFCGFIASFVVGYLCIKYFMKILSKISLKCFSYYCFIVSILMFILFRFYCHI